MRTRHARKIRAGILLAREVMARRRMYPRDLNMWEPDLRSEAFFRTYKPTPPKGRARA